MLDRKKNSDKMLVSTIASQKWDDVNKSSKGWLWTMSDMVKYRAALWSFLKLTALVFYHVWHSPFREVNIDQTVEERSHCQRGKKLSGNFQPFSFNFTFDNKVAQSLIQTENSIVANKLDPDQKKQTRRMPNIKVFSGRFSASFYSIYQFRISDQKKG